MKLLWLDLETEGLDPATCSILEVAVSVADLASPLNATPLYHAVLGTSDERVSKLHPIVFDMHTKNGLLTECLRSGKTVADVERDLLALIPASPDKEEMPVLAGSSIHFDHSFLRVHCPELSGRLSHRHYDVTAVKFFCQSLGMAKPPKAEAAHRAAEDIVASIEDARRCVDFVRGMGGEMFP